ncbi:hypothetical protein CCR75_007074 [Bremia lactucae]|uniref:Uncharacterized protein n=1 Tax=Bremia lactucae TaxID=4779 RepID=A0A976IBV7_BRELC|nr:hypothetical protein CCR75_007074 [Bremia lactucae]
MSIVPQLATSTQGLQGQGPTGRCCSLHSRDRDCGSRGLNDNPSKDRKEARKELKRMRYKSATEKAHGDAGARAAGKVIAEAAATEAKQRNAARQVQRANVAAKARRESEARVKARAAVTAELCGLHKQRRSTTRQDRQETQTAESTKDLDTANVSTGGYAANESSSHAIGGDNDYQSALSGAKVDMENPLDEIACTTCTTGGDSISVITVVLADGGGECPSDYPADANNDYQMDIIDLDQGEIGDFPSLGYNGEVSFPIELVDTFQAESLETSRDLAAPSFELVPLLPSIDAYDAQAAVPGDKTARQNVATLSSSQIPSSASAAVAAAATPNLSQSIRQHSRSFNKLSSDRRNSAPAFALIDDDDKIKSDVTALMRLFAQVPHPVDFITTLKVDMLECIGHAANSAALWHPTTCDEQGSVAEDPRTVYLVGS